MCVWVASSKNKRLLFVWVLMGEDAISNMQLHPSDLSENRPLLINYLPVRDTGRVGKCPCTGQQYRWMRLPLCVCVCCARVCEKKTDNMKKKHFTQAKTRICARSFTQRKQMWTCGAFAPAVALQLRCFGIMWADHSGPQKEGWPQGLCVCVWSRVSVNKVQSTWSWLKGA